MGYDVESIERYLRRRLPGRDLRRFDRAKRFVDEAGKRPGDPAAAHRLRGRWFRFLSRRKAVQTDICWPDIDFLRGIATCIGLAPAETDPFLTLSLQGRLWRASAFVELLHGPPEVVARLTRVAGWEYFARSRGEAGIILLPIHGQFARLSIPYLRQRGYDSLKVGIPYDDLLARGFRTAVEQRFELARQMHAAKHELGRGGIVFNAADALQNLDSSRSVEFFGRTRKIAIGFAELAIRTGARVMPVAYRFSPRGFFVQEFGAPFRDPGAQSSTEERIGALVAQYARFLRGEWRRYPWNIQWKQFRHYCEWPEIESGDTVASAVSPRVSALPR